MNRTCLLACSALILLSTAGAIRAQIGSAGRAIGGVTAAVNGAGAEELNSPGAAPVIEGVNGGREGIMGRTDAVATMRQNVVLSSSAQPLLPRGEYTAQAATGFADTNQFMTTLHAAHNMNIPFDDLKSKTTGKGHVSLERAARQLRPDLDEKTIKENLILAEKQSNRDIIRASRGAGEDRVASRIASNAALSSRVSALLPGSNVASAATGFHDEHQFISTAQAAHNLNLPFADLKDRVTAGQSLAEAIHAMKPEMSESAAHASAETATTQASELRTGKNTNARATAEANADAGAKAGQAGVSADANAHAGTDARIRK